MKFLNFTIRKYNVEKAKYFKDSQGNIWFIEELHNFAYSLDKSNDITVILLDKNYEYIKSVSTKEIRRNT